MPVIHHSKPCVGEEERSAFEAVLNSGMIAEGALTERFEAAVSRYTGLRGGVATASGTGALFLALKALGVGAGDEVIIPTYTCRSVWDAVRATQAAPVLSDIGDDWCVNAEAVRPLVTPRTKAVVVVHTFGIMADVDPICGLGVPVIEDCCHSLGARWGEKVAGTRGRLCVLSFHATKLLTTGEGGMALTDDEGLLERLRSLKRGRAGRLEPRHRSPLTDLQASMGLSQLAKYDAFLRRRAALADSYFRALDGLAVELPADVKGRSIFFRYPLRIRAEFESARSLFDRQGVQVRRGVDALLHRDCGMSGEDFPEAERAFSRTLSIPLYPALTDEERDRVVEACRRVFTDHSTGG